MFAIQKVMILRTFVGLNQGVKLRDPSHIFKSIYRNNGNGDVVRVFVENSL